MESPSPTNEPRSVRSDADLLFDHYCRTARKIYWGFSNSFETRLTGKKTYGGRDKNPRWDGGEDEYGREHSSIWSKIALTAVGAKIEIFDLISAQFNAATLGAKPTPDRCHGPRALANVQSTYEAAVNELGWMLRCHQEEFLVSVGMRIRKGMTVDEINVLTLQTIIDMKAVVEPMYRFCEATRLNVVDFITEEVRLSALATYMRRQAAYDRAWGKFVSPQLTRWATNVRASILQIRN